MFQSSPLCTLPVEILSDIALYLLLHDPSPSIRLILPLLQTCQHIYTALAFPHNSHLYSRFFCLRFDSSASARRLGTRTHDARHLAHQLRRYSSAITCIQRGDIYHEDVLLTFWSCFALLTENDEKNRPHLDAAGLPDFVDEFVRRRLYEDALSSNGWPKESPINSLALWLLWYTSTEERLKAETPARRSEIIRLVLPFVIVPFRYPSAYAPHNHFTMPLTNSSDTHPYPTIVSPHGPFPIYRSNHILQTSFYDRINFNIGIPLASTAARLIFFSRRQIIPIGVPVHLPLNREHAIQLGFADHIGPTQEDVHELNQHKVVHFTPPPPAEDATIQLSSVHDDDWYRLTDCVDPALSSSLNNTHYTYGSATGLWQGRNLVPSEFAFNDILQDVHMPEDFNEQQLSLNAAPVFMRLREYHCIDPQEPLPTVSTGDGFDDGIANAWMPNGVEISEARDTGTLVFHYHGRKYTYEAYRPHHPNSHDEATCNECVYRGTSEIVYRENDEEYLTARSDDSSDADAVMEEEEDDQFPDTSQYDPCIDSDVHQMEDEDSDVEEGTLDTMDFDLEEEYSVMRKCDGVRDIVLVGETDYKHGQAWHHYQFYGRVRKWDGLVSLVRIPTHPQSISMGLGIWVFSGYIVGGRNFVGTWRLLAGMGPQIPTLESSFAMTRREEGHS